MEIELPIVVYDTRWHEVMVYLSAEDAEASINVDDAKDNVYQIYDGDGVLLKIKYITQEESILFGLRKVHVTRPVIEKHNDTNHLDELREVLIKFISRYGTPTDKLTLFSLDDLIREAARLPKTARGIR